jgi:Na+/H+-dicarboxylate symporter
MKIVVGTSLTLVLTLGLWAFIYMTYPMFLDEDAIAKAAAGGLTPELEVRARAGFLKSSLVVYVTWGMVVGLIGAIAAGLGNSKLYIRVIIGLVLGAAVGAVTNYFTDQYAHRGQLAGDAIQYWLIRITAVHLPLAVVAAIVANIGHPPAEIAGRLVKAVLALIFAACIFSFLMGLVTPLEQAQHNFVRFPANSLSLLLSINLLVFLALAAKTTKSGGVKKPEPENFSKTD